MSKNKRIKELEQRIAQLEGKPAHASNANPQYQGMSPAFRAKYVSPCGRYMRNIGL